MVGRLLRRTRSNRGTTLVEAALSMVPWLLLTVGIVEGGRLLFEYSVVSNQVGKALASRVGPRKRA